MGYEVLILISLIFVKLYLLDNNFIRFGTKLYRQIVGIPMGEIVLLLSLTCFYFAMREILWPLFLIIKKMKLCKHLI